MSRTTGKSPEQRQPVQLELLWDQLLSRQPESIQAAFASLDTPSRKAVLEHLQHMSADTGWQPEQRKSAQAALQVLQAQSRQDE